jgi:hypothetical protein
MTDKIKIVQGDRKPRLQFTITDKFTASAIDLSDPLTTVVLDFRKKGTTTVTAIPCTKVGDGTGGIVYMDWPAGALDGDAGDYEGSLVLNFNGLKQTVYETLTFYTRSSF